LGGVPVQIDAGTADPIVTPAQSEALGDLLRRAGAAVSLDWVRGGHNLAAEDLDIGARFLTGIAGGGR
jgi:phospholipase/carboxylesterase